MGYSPMSAKFNIILVPDSIVCAGLKKILVTNQAGGNKKPTLRWKRGLVKNGDLDYSEKVKGTVTTSLALPLMGSNFHVLTLSRISWSNSLTPVVVPTMVSSTMEPLGAMANFRVILPLKPGLV